MIVNSPVFVLNVYDGDVGERIFKPFESYKVYEVKLQYVGLF